MFNGMAPILKEQIQTILKGECQVSEENKKEPTVKVFNKGKRIIQSEVCDINPLETVDIPEAEAKRLVKLFDNELIIVSEGQKSEGAADQESAKVKALEDKVGDLEATIEKMKEVAEDSDGKDQSQEVSTLKVELEKATAENGDLVDIIEKGEKDKKALEAKVKALEKKLKKKK